MTDETKRPAVLRVDGNSQKKRAANHHCHGDQSGKDPSRRDIDPTGHERYYPDGRRCRIDDAHRYRDRQPDVDQSVAQMVASSLERAAA